MKKAISALVLSLASISASAATITLEPDDGCINRVCVGVGNDAGKDITVYFTTGDAGSAGALIDGKSYNSLVGIPVSNAGFGPTVCYAADGSGYITLQATFTYWVTKGAGSGRGGGASHPHWALMSGSIITP